MPKRQVVNGMVVRIAQEADETSRVRYKEYEDCEILGPAIVAPLQSVTFDNDSFEGDPDAFLWEVPLDKMVIGVVGLEHVIFRKCRFKGVGIAAPPDFISEFRRLVQGS